MKEWIIKLLRFVVVGFIWANIISFAIPYFKSNEGVQKDILRIMPIGTSVIDVVEILTTKEKWYDSVFIIL